MKSPISATATGGVEEELWILTQMIGSSPSFYPQKDTYSLYFHIPFCTKKCSYCHFYVVLDNKQQQTVLMDGFAKEWQMLRPRLQGKKLISIYFGGGTPSLMNPKEIHQLIQMVVNDLPQSHIESLEITLEANPETVTQAAMRAYKEAGINRISIGVQTFDDAILPTLGRQHIASKALAAIEQTFNAGIENITIDLMYDLPQQTLQSWRRSLKRVEKLPISHLSLYNMTIEPHTLFHKQREQISKLVPDQEESLQMYLSAIEMLTSYGLNQYEISAFAKPGFHSRHNTGYWIGRPFFGLGPSAFSHWEGKRFRNIAHINKWRQALANNTSAVDYSEELAPNEQLTELLAVRLRLLEGVDMQIFQSIFGILAPETMSTLQQLAQEGYLNLNGSHVQLTRQGILFYDTVAAEII